MAAVVVEEEVEAEEVEALLAEAVEALLAEADLAQMVSHPASLLCGSTGKLLILQANGGEFKPSVVKQQLLYLGTQALIQIIRLFESSLLKSNHHGFV